MTPRAEALTAKAAGHPRSGNRLRGTLKRVLLVKGTKGLRIRKSLGRNHVSTPRAPRPAAAGQDAQWTIDVIAYQCAIGPRFGMLPAGLALNISRPGEPVGNRYVEHVQGKIREECPNANRLRDVADAHRIALTWQIDTAQEGPPLRAK